MTARWNTALWGTARWPALAVADLLQQPPVTGRGIPTGVGDWRLSVEVMLPADALSIWGIGTWADVEWTHPAWVDVTPHVRGAQWSRGADEKFGRPRVGQLVVTLDATSDRFSPWNPDGAAGEQIGFYAPGTVIRVGARSATDTRAGGWLPQITGIVDDWPISYAGAGGADRWVTVTAFETVGQLAQIDDNALPGVVGGGESAGDRFERLLAAAGWPYGLMVAAQNVAAGGYPLQSTNMAQNRLAELYRVADSCDTVFRSDRTGAAIISNPEYNTTPPAVEYDRLLPFSTVSTGNQGGIGFTRDEFRNTNDAGEFVFAPISADRLTTRNNKAGVINDARFARAGGTQQTAERVASIDRHGRRTLVRNDFLNTTDGTVKAIASYTTYRRALNTLSVEQLDLDVLARDQITNLAMMALDLYSYSLVYMPVNTPRIPPTPGVLGFVRSMSHAVGFGVDRLTRWDLSVSFDTRIVLNIPGAQLPADLA